MLNAKLVETRPGQIALRAAAVALMIAAVLLLVCACPQRPRRTTGPSAASR